MCVFTQKPRLEDVLIALLILPNAINKTIPENQSFYNATFDSGLKTLPQKQNHVYIIVQNSRGAHIFAYNLCRR